MMAAELAHVARFRDLIARIVSGVPDARFTQIPHLFGPPMECPAQVWEIRAGDNDCLATLGNEYFGGKLEISKNQEVFAAALKRYLEIQQLWVALTKEAKKFAEMNGSGKFDLDCRVRELVRVWHEFSRASKTGGRD
jgi:hypothetical protein